MIRIRVNGTPAPQGSKRHIGNGRMIESSKALGPWREAIRHETFLAVADWRDKMVVSAPITPYGSLTPVSVSVEFVLPRPRQHFRTGRNAHLLKDYCPAYPAGRPDLDKLVRAVLDGLTMGGAFADDAQVAVLSARKVYANGEPPGAVIEIKPCES